MTGKELRTLRVYTLHLTQEQLADVLGVDRRTVVRWERGKSVPAMVGQLLACCFHGIRPAKPG